MRKDSSDHSDICPGCVNENDSEEVVSNPVPYSDDCCSCCCSCCNEAISDVEDPIYNPINPNDVPAPGRALSHKKDLLKSLSFVRANRERASIQNVLQFVEALTYSNSFMRRYNMQEEFCLQCFQDPDCNCYVRDVSRLTLEDSCSCSACEASNRSEGSEETESPVHRCPDCPPNPKEQYERPRNSNRRNRRRRRRQWNSRLTASGSRDQRRRTDENIESNTSPDLRYYDSDCAQCRQTVQVGKDPRFDYGFCSCEDCIGEAERSNSERNRPSFYSGENKPECCDECSGGSCAVFSRHPCIIPGCEDCNRQHSDESTCQQDICNCLRSEDTRLCQLEDEQCNCCSHESSQRNTDTEGAKGMERQKVFGNLVGESYRHLDGKVVTSDKEDYVSCDCEECRNATECSDESCDECALHSSKKENFKKRE